MVLLVDCWHTDLGLYINLITCLGFTLIFGNNHAKVTSDGIQLYKSTAHPFYVYQCWQSPNAVSVKMPPLKCCRCYINRTSPGHVVYNRQNYWATLEAVTTTPHTGEHTLALTTMMNRLRALKRFHSMTPSLWLHSLSYVYVCIIMELWEPQKIQVYMTDVNHTLNHRQKVCYSPSPCDAGLLRAAPPAPSSGQGDLFLLTPGQLCSHAVKMRLTHTQSVHAFMSHTTHSTVHLSVWTRHLSGFYCTAVLALYRLTSMIQVTSGTAGGHVRVHTHNLLFIQRAATLIAEHPNYLSVSKASCSQQSSEVPLYTCKEEEKYWTG